MLWASGSVRNEAKLSWTTSTASSALNPRRRAYPSSRARWLCTSSATQARNPGGGSARVETADPGIDRV
jgi:hypothetical protein